MVMIVVVVITLKILQTPLLSIIIIVLYVDCDSPHCTEVQRWGHSLHLHCEGFGLLFQIVIKYDSNQIKAECSFSRPILHWNTDRIAGQIISIYNINITW